MLHIDDALHIDAYEGKGRSEDSSLLRWLLLIEVFASVLTYYLRTAESPAAKIEILTWAKGMSCLHTHQTFSVLSVISF